MSFAVGVFYSFKGSYLFKVKWDIVVLFFDFVIFGVEIDFWNIFKELEKFYWVEILVIFDILILLVFVFSGY